MGDRLFINQFYRLCVLSTLPKWQSLQCKKVLEPQMQGSYFLVCFPEFCDSSRNKNIQHFSIPWVSCTLLLLLGTIYVHIRFSIRWYIAQATHTERLANMLSCIKQHVYRNMIKFRWKRMSILICRIKNEKCLFLWFLLPHSTQYYFVTSFQYVA